MRHWRPRVSRTDTTVIELEGDEAKAFDDALAEVTNTYVAEVGGDAALAAIRGE